MDHGRAPLRVVGHCFLLVHSSNHSFDSLPMSLLWSTVSSWLQTLWNSLFTNKKGTLLLLGLDNAGKTTLLYALQTGTIQSFPPTDRPDVQEYKFGGVTFQAWDLGGHEAVRHLWDDYCHNLSAIVFVVDASDVERLEEAGYELDHLRNAMDDPPPMALLLNKCDLEQAASTEQALQAMDVEPSETLRVYRTSVLEGKGYPEALRWIASLL